MYRSYTNGLKSVATICIVPTELLRTQRASGSIHFVRLDFSPVCNTKHERKSRRLGTYYNLNSLKLMFTYQLQFRSERKHFVSK